MKTIVISIRPENVYGILLMKKTIEIRKTAPTKYPDVSTAYIYCTKTAPTLAIKNEKIVVFDNRYYSCYSNAEEVLNGKIVASFKIKKITALEINNTTDEILKNACITRNELKRYTWWESEEGYEGYYTWNITDLKIFEHPKKLSNLGLTKPPQSWQYLEDNKVIE
ncbi:MAG: hypothetical protein LBV51_01995 [Acholeplasmatales bacterium]|jgi:predicted transcriptional regulator|nr:hypothetical protein [Acholeplasmatales bacterium]